MGLSYYIKEYEDENVIIEYIKQNDIIPLTRSQWNSVISCSKLKVIQHIIDNDDTINTPLTKLKIVSSIIKSNNIDAAYNSIKFIFDKIDIPFDYIIGLPSYSKKKKICGDFGSCEKRNCLFLHVIQTEKSFRILTYFIQKYDIKKETLLVHIPYIITRFCDSNIKDFSKSKLEEILDMCSIKRSDVELFSKIIARDILKHENCNILKYLVGKKIIQKCDFEIPSFFKYLSRKGNSGRMLTCNKELINYLFDFIDAKNIIELNWEDFFRIHLCSDDEDEILTLFINSFKQCNIEKPPNIVNFILSVKHQYFSYEYKTASDRKVSALIEKFDIDPRRIYCYSLSEWKDYLLSCVAPTKQKDH